MTAPKEALELKPCPFCGKPPVLLATHETDRYIREYEVRCDNCGIGMSEEYESSAAELWNTRATASLEGDAVERVARIIAGPLCDATKGEHSIMAQGNYRFCTQCGETISKRTIGIVEARNKAAAILATGLVPDEAAVRADERERCAKVADGWLAQFAHHEIKYVSARMYASDAIQDIATALRSGGGE